MKTLLERIKKSYEGIDIQPANELLNYSNACDSYAEGVLGFSEMQNEICTYLDQSALRGRALSIALGRVKEPPLADIFTEATNMLVDAIVRTKELREKNITIASEKNIKLPNGGFRKPDVSIWCNNQLVAVVECKTCLGRARNIWLSEYDKRVNEFNTFGLKKDRIILFVETEQGWGGFSKLDPRINDVWFALCPPGTWHGGGKTGEFSLLAKQHSGIVESIHNKIKSIILDS